MKTTENADDAAMENADDAAKENAGSENADDAGRGHHEPSEIESGTAWETARRTACQSASGTSGVQPDCQREKA